METKYSLELEENKEMERDNKLSLQNSFEGSLDLGTDDEYEPPSNQRKTPSSKRRIQYYELNQHELNCLNQLTQNFKKSYKEIKDSQEMKEPPLNIIRKEVIIQYIKRYRQKSKRSNDHSMNEQKQKMIKPILGKRYHYKNSSYDTIIASENKKRQKIKAKNYNDEEPQNQLALFMIQNFQNQDMDVQMKMIQWINEKVNDDQNIQNKVLQKQVLQYSRLSVQYYELKEYDKIKQILSEVNPMAAIQIVLQISLTNEKLMEESYTLSQILLPYISICQDYKFLGPNDSFIMTRFLHSLISHIKDTKQNVAVGFILFGLYLDPSLIREILGIVDIHIQLKESLIQLGYNENIAKIISQNPKNLLWPSILIYYKNKTEKQYIDTLTIFTKLQIFQDPGNLLDEINSIFSNRRILIDKLLLQQDILISLNELTIILEKLKLFDEQILDQCFTLQCKEWSTFATQRYSKNDKYDNQLSQDQIINLYNSFTNNDGDLQILEKMEQISKNLNSTSQQYCHCSYQVCLASILIQQKGSFVITTVPTGSGKTWIQGLLAKYLLLQDKRVTLIEPNEILRDQTIEMIGNVGFDLSVITLQQYYEFSNSDEYIFLNEYDALIYEQPYAILNSQVNGLWDFKNKKVFAFSATSSNAIEKFVNNVIQKPTVLNFKSLYEVLQQVNPIGYGNIVTNKDSQKAINHLIQDIPKIYETKPVIVIIDQTFDEKISKFFLSKKWRFKKGATIQNLKEIRQWEYGILILWQNEARGVDTKFAKDASVMICCENLNTSTYLQMIGRSSRSRGICDSTLYLTCEENPSLFIDKLKSQNFSKMQSLEQMIKIIQQKQPPKYLIDLLYQFQKKGQLIITIEQLKQQLSETRYLQLLKTIKN